MLLSLNPLQALFLAAFLGSVFFLLYTQLALNKTPFPLPPGPPGKFLIGNFGQVSIDRPEQDYIRLGKEYDSDVIYTNVLGQHVICLNSIEAAKELLEKRGLNYSDRPRFRLFELMGWGLTLTFLRFGPQFKIHRSLFQQTFTQSNVKTFRPIQVHEARKAVRFLLQDPDDWLQITLLMATSIIFRIAFGQEIVNKDSPYVKMSLDANDATTSGGVAGSSIVDLFPPARFLPNWLNPSPSLRHARASRNAIQTVQNVPWEANMKDIEAGTAAPSFMKTHWEKFKRNEKAGIPQDITPADLKGATGAVFIAGGNTTWATIQCCLMFLTKYPHVQQKLLAELDALLLLEPSTPRLPTYGDRGKLPYLDNFIQEAMRTLPLNPLIIPHRSIEDDVYENMFIPAGTTVFANVTAMNNDTRTYRDPQLFDPDRYAPPRAEPYPVGNFGFGRRKCPGNHLALASVYVFLATFLAAFELEQVRGEDGELRIPEPSVSVGLGGDPHPFECKLKVRSPSMARLLIKEKEGRF
ncbi:cytochrome P450 1A2 [Pseudomassariella vexata]|uniref:Cytochrome P450 1A2 n=1 Tax=Pseudomassariella vexata TaxID=1141098 RepID=A0A1Y2E8G2_9PEZI|nr:cytochrome P450 1A2 [Pseudomassariella vexata]ORY67604.1 cytochrome P450 1A2 [Pseudomassariella vexata]